MGRLYRRILKSWACLAKAPKGTGKRNLRRKGVLTRERDRVCMKTNTVPGVKREGGREVKPF